MALLRNIAIGLRSLLRKERVEKELDEELRGFLEMAAEEKIKEGMNSKDALRAVRLERGNLEVTKEFVRAAGWDRKAEEAIALRAAPKPISRRKAASFMSLMRKPKANAWLASNSPALVFSASSAPNPPPDFQGL